jgi:hypothetical protein
LGLEEFLELSAERCHIYFRNTAVLAHEAKNFRTLELIREVSRTGDKVHVDVFESFFLRQAEDVLFRA